MGDWFRNVLSCCDREDEEDQRPALQISGPTNFRREDIKLPGLDPEQQRWIREKAIADAGRMYEHLSPLRSSPSGQFADPHHTATLPSYEEFTTPRPAPALAPASTSSVRRTSVGSHALDRVRAHTRKISNSLTKPLGGYQAVGVGAGGLGMGTGMRTGGGGAGGREYGSPYEMWALMDPSRTQVVGGSPGKMSGEGYSVAGSEEEREGGRGGSFDGWALALLRL
ncbi:hypothetical protein B0A55_02181 [Friedmanniomyces simplex]|uniref:Uncharacterized protein n=1 Tax=Friedmanniomyces simplex TaxID=329884 RepID=A0A4U0Y4M3_9PEZI|nr:hypothetical protein B0A55_02181 [Friedmanniomyces simplex]